MRCRSGAASRTTASVGFRTGVDALRRGRIVLDVLARLRSVENKIGAHVEHESADLGGGAGHDGRRVDVRPTRLRRMRLGAVHVGPRGEVEDGARAQVADGGGHGSRVGGVEVVEIGQPNRRRRRRRPREVRREGAAEKAPRPGDQNRIMPRR